MNKDAQNSRRYFRTYAAIMVCALLGTAGWPAAVRAELSEDTIQETFYPYRHGAPQVAGIEPGVVINQSNWEVAKEVMYPEYLDLVKKGWVEIKVGETITF